MIVSMDECVRHVPCWTGPSRMILPAIRFGHGELNIEFQYHYLFYWRSAKCILCGVSCIPVKMSYWRSSFSTVRSQNRPTVPVRLDRGPRK